MFTKKIAFVLAAALASLQLAAAAQPPACLLDVMGAQSDPSDLKTICADKSIAGKISDTCDSETTDAMNAYVASCKAAGFTASTSTSSSTKSSGTASATGSSTSGSSAASTPGSGSDAGSEALSTSSSTSTPAPSSGADRTNAAFAMGIAALGFAVGTAALL